MYYLTRAQLSPSGVTRDRGGVGGGGGSSQQRSTVDDVDPLPPVTTCRRNSSNEANSRVLFPPDSVPHADNGRERALSSQGEIRRGSCTIAACPLSRDAHSTCPPRSADAHDTTIAHRGNPYSRMWRALCIDIRKISHGK